MKYNVCILLNVLYSVFKLSKSQYIIMNSKLNKSNQCDPNNTLVEQFFNLIFTEFHNTPPVCVCVQMCMEKPAYCYPNSCLKRPNTIKVDTTTTGHPVNQIHYDGQNQAKTVMFLVENDLIDNIFEEPRINLLSETREKLSNELIFCPHPFKELVFKYRKLPKLEMRYNLREKVKNTRSEKIKRNKVDVSKTRWPMNKHFLQGKQLLNSIRNLNKDDGFQRTIFVSMFPELESASNKVNKNNKFLSKRNDRSVNIDSLHVYDTDAANFSIENLIDNLIINSLNENNNNNTKSNESLVTKQNLANKNDNETNHADANTVSIILINTTNKNIDNNNYTYDLNSTKVNKTYLEEIIIMSERIEENNNLSVEFVKRVTGLSNLENETSILQTKNCSLDSFETKSDHNVDLKQTVTPQTINATIISNKTIVEVASATKRRTVPVLTKKFKQKSKQRLIRKLDRKLN